MQIITPEHRNISLKGSSQILIFLQSIQLLVLTILIKQDRKCHNVRIVLKSARKIVETKAKWTTL